MVEPETGSVPEAVDEEVPVGTFWPIWRVKFMVWPSPVTETE